MKAAESDESFARPSLMNADEIAQELGCSRSHVFEMAAQGRIPHYKIGRLVRFDLDEVIAASRKEVAADAS